MPKAEAIEACRAFDPAIDPSMFRGVCTFPAPDPDAFGASQVAVTFLNNKLVSLRLTVPSPEATGLDPYLTTLEALRARYGTDHEFGCVPPDMDCGLKESCLTSTEVFLSAECTPMQPTTVQQAWLECGYFVTLELQYSPGPEPFTTQVELGPRQ